MVDGFDFSELVGLQLDLTAAAVLIPKKAQEAVQQASIKTKKEWAKDALRTLPKRAASAYAPTIDYQEREFGGFGQGVYASDIGPDLARYGGKTGKGGLFPSAGIFDDPQSGVRGAPPSRSRQRAEKFAEKELLKGAEIALEQSLKRAGL